jgi:predicted PurR-regulated permease PerM
MSQIRNIAVSIFALIILFFIVQQAIKIGAPPIFTLVAAFIVVLILWNVVRRLIRGY